MECEALSSGIYHHKYARATLIPLVFKTKGLVVGSRIYILVIYDPLSVQKMIHRVALENFRSKSIQHAKARGRRRIEPSVRELYYVYTVTIPGAINR